MKKLFEKVWIFLVDRFSGRNAKNFEVHDEIITLPNMVTITGILWTIIYVILYAFGITPVFIPVLVVLIVLTDTLDGYCADRFNQHSKYGKVLDPLRDRLFTFALLGNICIIGGIPVLIPAVVLFVFEFCLALYYYDVHHLTGKILEVHWIGKARSALQWVLGFAIIVQFYWLGAVYVSPAPIVWIMAMASIVVYSYSLALRWP